TGNGEAISPSIFVDEVQRHFGQVDGQPQVVQHPPALPSVPLPVQCREPGELLRRAAMSWGASGGATGGCDLPILDEALRSRGVMVERLRTLASIEALGKDYLLSSGPTIAITRP